MLAYFVLQHLHVKWNDLEGFNARLVRNAHTFSSHYSSPQSNSQRNSQTRKARLQSKQGIKVCNNSVRAQEALCERPLSGQTKKPTTDSDEVFHRLEKATLVTAVDAIQERSHELFLSLLFFLCLLLSCAEKFSQEAVYDGLKALLQFWFKPLAGG